MNFDLTALGPLASAIETAGAPILAAALRAIAPIAGAAVPIPFAGPIVVALLNALADAVGGDASNPATITAKIQTDPAAPAKLQAVQTDRLADIEALIKVQEDLDLAEINITSANWRDALLKFYFAGWRPFAGWTFGAALAGSLVSTWCGWTPPPGFLHFFDGTTTIFLLLIGSRTTDKIFGVATNNLKSAAGSVVSPIVKKWNVR